MEQQLRIHNKFKCSYVIERTYPISGLLTTLCLVAVPPPGPGFFGTWALRQQVQQLFLGAGAKRRSSRQLTRLAWTGAPGKCRRCGAKTPFLFHQPLAWVIRALPPA